MEKYDIDYLYKLAYIDLMTGLKNRNAYEERLTFLRKIENLEMLSGAVMDIDCLKMINDTYGHYAGDEAIKTVGVSILKAFENGELCFRVGGDEFVCLTYGSITEAIHNFEKDFKLKKLNLEFDFTVSVGYAAYDKKQDKTIMILSSAVINLCILTKIKRENNCKNLY